MGVGLHACVQCETCQSRSAFRLHVNTLLCQHLPTMIITVQFLIARAAVSLSGALPSNKKSLTAVQ